jgi:hypothetical protein
MSDMTVVLAQEGLVRSVYYDDIKNSLRMIDCTVWLC